METDRLLVTGKGNKQRWVPISGRTRKALWQMLRSRGEEQLDSDDPLFPTREGFRMTRHTLYDFFRRLGDAAGIEGAHPHPMRHTTATETLPSGMGMVEVKRLLGHESLTMVQRY